MMGLELVAHILDLAREAEKRNEAIQLLPTPLSQNRDPQIGALNPQGPEVESQPKGPIPEKSGIRSIDQSEKS